MSEDQNPRNSTTLYARILTKDGKFVRILSMDERPRPQDFPESPPLTVPREAFEVMNARAEESGLGLYIEPVEDQP